MLFHMFIALWLVSLLLEGMVAYRITWYRHFMQHNEWIAAIVSMALSWWLGKLFGAMGLIALMAGIASTATSPFMYKALNWYEVNQTEVLKKYAQVRQTFIDTGILIYKILRLITIPIRAIRWGHQQVVSLREAARPSV